MDAEEGTHILEASCKSFQHRLLNIKQSKCFLKLITAIYSLRILVNACPWVHELCLIMDLMSQPIYFSDMVPECSFIGHSAFPKELYFLVNDYPAKIDRIVWWGRGRWKTRFKLLNFNKTILGFEHFSNQEWLLLG